MAAPRFTLVACVLAIAACAPSTPRPDRTAPSAHATCLEPSRARSFSVLDDEVILVDAGSDHYRMEVEPACRGVDFAFALKFRGDPVTGRVCGFHDAILTDRGECRIDRLDWITREEYDRLSKPKKAATPAPEKKTPR